MAIIKLKYIPASQLFKRLSSYAKNHLLCQALKKEFGRGSLILFYPHLYDGVKIKTQYRYIVVILLREQYKAGQLKLPENLA